MEYYTKQRIAVSMCTCECVYLKRLGEGLFSYVGASGCLGRRFDFLHQWNPSIHLSESEAGSEKQTCLWITVCEIACWFHFSSPSR